MILRKEETKMIYVSHLLPDREMAEVLEQTGAGIESIDFFYCGKIWIT